MPDAAGAARPAVILIATKQEWATRSLESILAPRGYVVLRSYTARRTLERALRDRPDIIVLDAQLPDANGDDLCRALRTRHIVGDGTPILLTLPRPATRHDRVAALRAGAWGCLSEPFDAEEVLALIGTFGAAKLAADRARVAGLVDEETGLYNVRGLTRRAREVASHASRAHAALACVVLAPDAEVLEPDVAPGDLPPTVLQHVTRALKSAGRRSDVVGRLGPSAFVVVALDADATQARRLAERLGQAIVGGVDPPGEPPPFRLQVGCHGVADFHAATMDAVELILHATAALRKARTDPAGGWLRNFDDGGPAPRAG